MTHWLLLVILLAGCATHDACYWRALAVSQGAPRFYALPEAEQDCRAWGRLNLASPGGAE